MFNQNPNFLSKIRNPNSLPSLAKFLTFVKTLPNINLMIERLATKPTLLTHHSHIYPYVKFLTYFKN